MKQFITLVLACCAITTLYAQQSKGILIKSAAGEPLPGATVQVKNIGRSAIADSNGLVLLQNIPPGSYTLTISFTGLAELERTITFPLPPEGILITLAAAEAGEEEEEEEVIVTATRTSRSIAANPTRVEIISGEELDEKNNMRPANVSMLLHESTGLQVQQTSATTGNAAIRMQGLDGRYTQLLKNGSPNYGNFAGGLSILEIPPLDLQQVEVIKGPASTLYGGGAIAGVINFVSRTPKEKAAYDFIFNQSNIGQTNVAGFAAHKKGSFGYTLLAAYNRQRVFDVDGDDFSELPKGSNFTLSPVLFFYPGSRTTISIGSSLTRSSSIGGDVQVTEGKPDAYHTYFEKNSTTRSTTTLELESRFTAGTLRLKQSYSIFNRSISSPGHLFEGRNRNSFTDLSWIAKRQQHLLVAGLSIAYDRFRQQQGLLDAQSTAAGFYLQDTWDVTEHLKLEPGIRVDGVRHSNTRYRKTDYFALPRLSVLYRINGQLTTRISGGMGYKTPSIFTEQAETLQYRDIVPLNNVRSERSSGLTAGAEWKTKSSHALQAGLSQLFFYTIIRQPLVLQQLAGGGYSFYTAGKPISSSGFETNLKLTYKNDLKLFAGYTYTNARRQYLPANKVMPLQPAHRINLTLMYEKEDNFKLGLEAYYTGSQYLNDYSATPSFWEAGFMAQKTFGHVSFFVNFENFTDQRQSRYKTVAGGPHSNPVFDDIWNHTEGFIMNGGIKLKW